MSGTSANANGKERLTLRSQRSELARVSPWVERLAMQDSIPKKTQFAINLCLEEALSNIIRHGYKDAANHQIGVAYTMPQAGVFVFVVEDTAPPFDPVTAVLPAVPKTLDDFEPGGQGIRLLKNFADALEYESTPSGNRLRMSFIALPDAKD